MIIVADVDNTLSAGFHREKLIDEDGWDAFHLASVHDEPITEMIALVNALTRAGHHVICLTGRPEKYRGITLTWLIHHGVEFAELYMRGNDDYRPAAIMKLDIARTSMGGDLRRISLILEDNEAIAAAWAEEGITTLLVRARRPELV
jgi:hypothetical protein